MHGGSCRPFEWFRRRLRPPGPTPQPPGPEPAPGDGQGPVLPELPGGGSGDPSLAEKVQRLETRLSSLETTLHELRSGYEDIRQQWPQVREILLSSDLPQAKELVQRIEQIDTQLRRAVSQAENAARQAAQEETRGLKERVAQLLGKVDALGTAVQLAGQYAQARREGADPRGALATVLDAKLQSLESRLMSRVENLDRGSLATALTYVGVPSVAATIIAFFLAGALRSRLSERLELLMDQVHQRLEKEKG